MSQKGPKVYLWDSGSLIADGTELDREYLTEVFAKTGKPTPNSVVVAIGQPAIHFDDDPFADPKPGPESIVGIALVSSLRGVAMGKVLARLQPWTPIRPYPIEEAIARAYSFAFAEAREGVDRGSKVPGPPTLLTAIAVLEPMGQALLDAIGEHDPNARQWLATVRRDRTTDRTDGQAQARHETRDAVDLAGRLAAVDIPDDVVLDPPNTQATTLLESVIATATRGDLEEDLLPADLRRFDGQVRAEMPSASVAVFRSQKVQLVVYNVNKKPVEQILGVDLIYWDLTHHVFTLIQYKRLERDAVRARPGHTNTQWVYKREAELLKQLALMPDTESVARNGSADWRMTQTPFWFKFVRGDAAAHDDGKLLKGMYVPADYLRLAIVDGSLRTGPEGGFRVDYDNTRYVTRDVFIQLVQRGLVGTTAAQSDLLKQVVADLSSAGRSVVVAVKARWQERVQQREVPGLARTTALHQLSSPF